jgi:hypothetical protein
MRLCSRLAARAIWNRSVIGNVGRRTLITMPAGCAHLMPEEGGDSDEECRAHEKRRRKHRQVLEHRGRLPSVRRDAGVPGGADLCGPAAGPAWACRQPGTALPSVCPRGCRRPGADPATGLLQARQQICGAGQARICRAGQARSRLMDIEPFSSADVRLRVRRQPGGEGNGFVLADRAAGPAAGPRREEPSATPLTQKIMAAASQPRRHCQCRVAVSDRPPTRPDAGRPGRTRANARRRQ